MSDAKTISDVDSPKLPWEVFPESGDSFAGYTLGESLGKGSFGTVFKVQSDPDVEWFEAIKILHRSGDIDKQRFLDEISRLKEIRIPGMARIHGAGEYDGYLYYSMDYIEGQTIDEYAESCSQKEIFQLFFDLCDTVHRLHELKFVHLDIKPHNVMVNEEGQIRLLDLGISQKTGEGKDISSEGFGAGTYEYAPAEQIDGKSPNNSMDVYSLGCLLYTLLSSAHPKIPYDKIKREKPYGVFYPQANIEREVLLKLCLSSDNKDIRDQGILINDKASSAIMKSLSDPEARFVSVKEFKESLEKSGVLLDAFVIAYEELAGDLFSRISKAVNDISLEF
ncbi:MAG: serine/threonine protein kinase, partial [Lentisphaeraceae bacterium]|nr:serine/threonine protein kinase [Lentisphaeraceae bacterium]